MSDNNQQPRPILMVPIRRCGSHALRLRLNFSEDFYSPYPLHLVDFMPLVPLYGDLSDDNSYFQLVIDLVGLQNATMVKWDKIALDPVAVFNAIKDNPKRSPHLVFWQMLFQAGKQHNAEVVMDKSLDSIYYSKELMELFDDLLFINVVRDPRAQVASINRAIIHDFDTLLNTQRWVKAHEAAQQLAEQYPDRVLTIRYEDFLHDQQRVLKAICDFTGIAFLPEMLDVSKSTEANSIAPLSRLWQSNTSAPILAYIDKFKKQLSEQEIQIIETLAGDHMSRHGYDRITTG
jgi:hypothetical protein